MRSPVIYSPTFSKRLQTDLRSPHFHFQWLGCQERLWGQLHPTSVLREASVSAIHFSSHVHIARAALDLKGRVVPGPARNARIGECLTPQEGSATESHRTPRRFRVPPPNSTRGIRMLWCLPWHRFWVLLDNLEDDRPEKMAVASIRPHLSHEAG